MCEEVVCEGVVCKEVHGGALLQRVRRYWRRTLDEKEELFLIFLTPRLGLNRWNGRLEPDPDDSNNEPVV